MTTDTNRKRSSSSNSPSRSDSPANGDEDDALERGATPAPATETDSASQTAPLATRTVTRWLPSGLAIPALLGAVLLGYFIVPFAVFFLQVGSVDVLSGLADPTVQQAIQSSLLTAPISTAIATVFGVPLAYVLSRASFRGKRLLEAAVLIPLVLPPIVGGVVLLTVVGRYTPIGAAAAALGYPLTGSHAGVILAQTFVAAPFLVVTAKAGFDSVDRRLEEAARTMGYGPLETARLVSLPLARNAIGAGIILTFVRAIGEFGATMMVAYNPRTMPTQIRVSYISHGLEAIVPIALALIAITLAVTIAVQLLVGTPRQL
ncbi:ABC transporter permease subunit [Natronolimnobius sp. AArcel1]|uniref:ABC transporter permease n=1 Tax=Natronolimnobius sp. AArcel1 TaxID=1679093 RepID=UPI0013ED5FAD|nr:ABC transporter permease [Natronolimnobius sp. AArcel1]NGM70991.1 ABC transporter permease subunit [Natronolimnobius sp. AArcel1]